MQYRCIPAIVQLESLSGVYACEFIILPLISILYSHGIASTYTACMCIPKYHHMIILGGSWYPFGGGAKASILRSVLASLYRAVILLELIANLAKYFSLALALYLYIWARRMN